MAEEKKYKIKIIKNGPYLITGNIPLSEKIITPKGRGYEFKSGRELPQAEVYRLCRCGKSKNMPFCDGSHENFDFDGNETASRAKYKARADLIEGPALDLMDDGRCAFGRFCHSEKGNVWELIRYSDEAEYKELAIKAAIECPAGRLQVFDKSGNIIEPEYEPSIEVIQDPEKGVSSGIFVKGNVPLEAADGQLYELRNRYALCRCGHSSNKPFCDATHVPAKFSDD